MSLRPMGYKSKNIGYTSTYMQLSVSAHSFEYVVKHKHKSLKDPYITRVLGPQGLVLWVPISCRHQYTHTHFMGKQSHTLQVSLTKMVLPNYRGMPRAVF